MENVPKGQGFKVVIHVNRKPENEHIGRYNAPTTSEIALAIVVQDFET